MINHPLPPHVRVLRLALILIETVGWTQDTLARYGGWAASLYSPKTDCFCLTGALNRAAWMLGAQAAGHEAYDVAYDHAHGCVADWNDNSCRTKEDVVAMLRKAIAMETPEQFRETQVEA